MTRGGEMLHKIYNAELVAPIIEIPRRVIVYTCSSVRRHCGRHRGHCRGKQFQTSPPKPLGRSKPNFMLTLTGKGEQKFV